MNRVLEALVPRQANNDYRGVPSDGLEVDLAAPVIERRAELEELGWQVVVYDGLDHMQVTAEHVAATVLAFLDGKT